MLEPSRVFTPEETTLFIAELQQRWREAGDSEKEQLASVFDHWLKSVTHVLSAPSNEETLGGDAARQIDPAPSVAS